MFIFSLAIVAQAHHASAPHYDRDKPVTIEGVVTEFKLVNPHAYLYIDVTNENGETENWNCEMNASSSLRRAGWSADTIKVGAEIVIQGSAARRDPLGCAFSSATLADGTELERGGTITAGSGTVTAAPVAVTALTDSDRSLFSVWQTAPRNFGGAAGGMGAPAMGGMAQAAGNFGPGEGSEEDPLGRFSEFLTEEGRRVSLIFDDRFDDPALFCSPSSIIRGWSEPSGTSEISQVEDQIFIKHEFMDTVRVVYMDGRDHPEDGDFGFAGHSIGHFEGDELVIETTRFDAGVLFPHPGVLHSDQLVVEERIRVSEDGSQLSREYSAMDPLHFTKPITGNNTWIRTDLPLGQYDCVELGGVNNQRPE